MATGDRPAFEPQLMYLYARRGSKRMLAHASS